MRIYIYTPDKGPAEAFQSLRDLCNTYNLTEGTIRNALLRSDHYENRKGETVTRSELIPCEGRKRPGNARNWAKNGEM